MTFWKTNQILTFIRTIFSNLFSKKIWNKIIYGYFIRKTQQQTSYLVVLKRGWKKLKLFLRMTTHGQFLTQKVQQQNWRKNAKTAKMAKFLMVFVKKRHWWRPLKKRRRTSDLESILPNLHFSGFPIFAVKLESL